MRRSRQGKAVVEASVSDGSSTLKLVFFNQAWRERQIPVGTEIAFYGKLDIYQGSRQMTNPIVDVIGGPGERTGVIVPIYRQSGKADISTWQLQKLVAEALRRIPDFADPLPDQLRAAHSICDRTTAYQGIHRPQSARDHVIAAHRLKFDEFLRMQVGLVARKRAIESLGGGIAHVVSPAQSGGADTSGYSLLERFISGLPFPLTGAQLVAIDEISSDLARPIPMHRLLQGDVGSGKTVVAVSALLVGVQGGWQGAFMAPTEVLAEQHYLSVAAMLQGLTILDDSVLGGERPVRVALLTNRTLAAERKRLAADLLARSVDILVGTHALLYGDATFGRLGVVVIDEQHRFGVEQRALLRAKGGSSSNSNGGDGDDSAVGAGALIPDVLVMTATPIPRTAAMLVYGDLDRSELREMPPGRTPVETIVISRPGEGHLELGDGAGAFERVRSEVEAGHQAFVVCPLVEGSEKSVARAATEELERLGSEELVGLRLGLLHGQMKAAVKAETMAAFRRGELDVLVATTVIEVGVDVPNATVMVIEDAELFGLAQLHQLRGRVGRGGGESWCYLLGDPKTPDGEARLSAMAASTDGFALAEKDLEIRGAGQAFGERQAGFSDLKLGRIPRDEEIVIDARRAAEEILDADPVLTQYAQLAEEVEDLLGDAVEFLFKS